MKESSEFKDQVDMVNASTAGYMYLQEWLSGNANQKTKRIGKKEHPRGGQRVFLGGLIRPTSCPTRLGGDNPRLPVKMDLMPTDSKEPTPRWMTAGTHQMTGMGEDYLVLERFMQAKHPEREMFQFDLECILSGEYRWPKSAARKSLSRPGRPGGPRKPRYP